MCADAWTCDAPRMPKQEADQYERGGWGRGQADQTLTETAQHNGGSKTLQDDSGKWLQLPKHNTRTASLGRRSSHTFPQQCQKENRSQCKLPLGLERAGQARAVPRTWHPHCC